MFDQKELNMKQRRRLEFLKDYEFELNYHLGKANVVDGSLSKKSLHMSMLMVKEMDHIEQLKDLRFFLWTNAKKWEVGYAENN